MGKRVAVFVGLCCALAIGTSYGQECLHGANENPEQAGRRREALLATRTINTIQANQPGASKGSYLRQDQLAGSAYWLKMRESGMDTVKRISLEPRTDILQNWELTLDVSPTGYWFVIRDRADPCGFSYISNQAGLIFRAEPIGPEPK